MVLIVTIIQSMIIIIAKIIFRLLLTDKFDDRLTISVTHNFSLYLIGDGFKLCIIIQLKRKLEFKDLNLNLLKLIFTNYKSKGFFLFLNSCGIAGVVLAAWVYTHL